MNSKQMLKEILALKTKHNALILAHYYQNKEIQDIADLVGDSFQLSKAAAETDADAIVFCGVHFMAETAKLLSPNKRVLLPVKDAGCPMADMADAKTVKEYREKHPDASVVCYVNSTAEIKALSDICVTSANAEKILKRYPGQKFLYVPDKNLAKYLIDKHDLNIDLFEGWCDIHNDLTVEDVKTMKEKYPDARFIAHPEAPLEVLREADFVGGTQALLSYARQDEEARTYLIGTEEGLIHELRKQSPDKTFLPVTDKLTCEDMKKTTLKDLHRALKEGVYEIEVDSTIREAAEASLRRMMAESAQ